MTTPRPFFLGCAASFYTVSIGHISMDLICRGSK
jgi:hypothetical protein